MLLIIESIYWQVSNYKNKWIDCFGLVGWMWIYLNKLKTQKRKIKKKILKKIKEKTQRSRVVTPHNIIKKMNWFSYLIIIN